VRGEAFLGLEALLLAFRDPQDMDETVTQAVELDPVSASAIRRIARATPPDP
jgi:hypothetical protein